MKISSVVRALVAAKATPEMILAAVEAAEADQMDALEARRKSDRERQAKRRSHVTSRDVTVTGPSHARVEDNLQSNKSTGEDRSLPSAPTKRATRLPGDWEPDIGFAESLGLTRQDAESEATKFREWWPAQPGQKGVKADWSLTWKTWCRKAAERRPLARAGSPPKPKTISDVFRDDAKRNGLIPNDEPTCDTRERVETSDRSRSDGGSGITRRFAVTSDIFGRIG